MELSAKIAHFPSLPGVYLMRDAAGRLLYVGKAKDLRTRVRNYFREGADGRASVRFLMARVADIDFVVTDTEKEALILENTLIKRHHPKYNVDLRDDKTYLSLRLDVQSRFPRLTAVRQIERDGALYFGPYSSAKSLRETVEVVHRLFPLRQCSDAGFRNRTRPCLYCQIRGCRAPCCGLVDEADYGRIVDQVVLFLKGRSGDLLSGLRDAMTSASERLDYEEAARLRDRIRDVELTLERQKAVTHELVDRDVVGFVREGAEVEFVVLVVRSGNLIDRRAYHLADVQLDDGEALGAFLQQYYRGDRIVPGEILVSRPLGDEEGSVLEEWLSERRGRRVRLLHPRRGDKADLVRMAEANAKELLEERRKTKVGYEAALRELQARLGLSRSPRRIECFDISNVQGTNPTGSLATLSDGFPDKGGYRKFAVRSVEGADDFAMLYEVLTRRLARRQDPKWALPDLLVIDGGRGQLASALRALADAGVPDLPVVGLAKARALPGEGEDVEHSPERVFLPGRKNPLVLPKNSSALFLLQRVRDEAHRFAVAYHRKRRSQSTLTSVLEAIPGVGEGRRRTLLRHFGSLKRLRAASWEEIAEVPGIPREIARRVAAGLKEAGG